MKITTREDAEALPWDTYVHFQYQGFPSSYAVRDNRGFAGTCGCCRWTVAEAMETFDSLLVLWSPSSDVSATS